MYDSGAGRPIPLTMRGPNCTECMEAAEAFREILFRGFRAVTHAQTKHCRIPRIPDTRAALCEHRRQLALVHPMECTPFHRTCRLV